jgi:hypothetical protein
MQLNESHRFAIAPIEAMDRLTSASKIDPAG